LRARIPTVAWTTQTKHETTKVKSSLTCSPEPAGAA
jgi:hypothetical protein